MPFVNLLKHSYENEKISLDLIISIITENYISEILIFMKNPKILSPYPVWDKTELLYFWGFMVV